MSDERFDKLFEVGIQGDRRRSVWTYPDAGHPWQSPDIEISNAKSLANAQFANVPWNGHPNTVTAKISNGGTLSAPGVTARFYWKDYTIGGAPETFISSDTHDVGPGATVDFQVTWTPQPPADPAKQQHHPGRALIRGGTGAAFACKGR